MAEQYRTRDGKRLFWKCGTCRNAFDEADAALRHRKNRAPGHRVLIPKEREFSSGRRWFEITAVLSLSGS
jgi:uncharacterized C2H2 Zn-finger protein